MKEKITRRDLVKGMLYVAPAILTLKALPAFAQNGSNFPAQSQSLSGSSDSWSGSGSGSLRGSN